MSEAKQREESRPPQTQLCLLWLQGEPVVGTKPSSVYYLSLAPHFSPFLFPGLWGLWNRPAAVCLCCRHREERLHQQPCKQCHLRARDQKFRVKPKYLLISDTGELCVEASWCCHCVLWSEGGPAGAVFRPVCSLHSYCMSSAREKFLFPAPFPKGGAWGEAVEFSLMLSPVMGLSRTCSFKKCPLPHHPPSFQLQH